MRHCPTATKHNMTPTCQDWSTASKRVRVYVYTVFHTIGSDKMKQNLFIICSLCSCG